MIKSTVTVTCAPGVKRQEPHADQAGGFADDLFKWEQLVGELDDPRSLT